MIGKVLGILTTAIKLPIKIILLPYKAISFLMSLVLYLMVLAIVGGAVYFLVL